MNVRALAVACVVSAAVAPLARAQDQPEETPRPWLRPMLGAHLGYASVERADNTFEIGASLDVGSYRTPRLRVALGVDYLSTEPTRGQSRGSYSDLSVNADLRLKPFRIRSVAPYLGGGLGLHFQSNDIPEANIADIYDGVAVGVQAFLGILVDGAESGRWGVSGELRSVRAKNLSRTSLRGGLFLRL